MRAARRRIDGVLFDLGGTLVDVRDFAGWASRARHRGLTTDPEPLRDAFVEVELEFDRAAGTPGQVYDGRGREVEFWVEVLTRATGHEVDPAAAEAFLRDSPPAAEHPLALYSDVRRCLDALADGRRRLGVVSNSASVESVRTIVERVGILPYFACLVSSGTEGVAKPDPRIFLRGAERLNVEPGRTIYVGNLEHTDALAARAAGLFGVWLNREGTGYGSGTPEVTSLLEVPIVLERLERGDPTVALGPS